MFCQHCIGHANGHCHGNDVGEKDGREHAPNPKLLDLSTDGHSDQSKTCNYATHRSKPVCITLRMEDFRVKGLPAGRCPVQRVSLTPP